MQMHIKLCVWTLGAMLMLAQSAWAVTCTSVATTQTDWNKPVAWSGCGGVQPPAGATVVIAPGTNILADANTLNVANITVQAGGTLAILSGNTISLSGNFTNNGTFTAPAGSTVALTGTNQTITGNVTFANLTLSPTTVLTLAGNIVVTGTLTGMPNLVSTCPTNYTITNGAGAVIGQSCATPTVTSINTASVNPTTSGAAVSWTVLFGASVSGVTAANFALVQAGGVSGATITSVTGAGTTWTVNASAGTGTGTLGLNMVNATGISPAVTSAMPFVGQIYTVSAPPLGAFDAYDTGNVLVANGGPILTHVAGLAFSVDVVRVRAGSNPPAIDTAYRSRITVDVVDASLPGFGCAAAAAIPGTIITPAANTRMVSGKLTYSITVPDAYQNLQLRVNSGGVMTCPVNHFAVRPDRFTVPVVSDTDWVTAGATRVLNNLTAVTAAPVHKAGQPFQLTATAVDAVNAPVLKYAGTPDAVVCVGATTNCMNGRTLAADSLKPTATQPTPAVCAGTACVGNPGALNVGAGAVAGVLTSNAATYSEVGAFTLQLQDQLFANIDSGDTGSVADCSAAGRYVCSTTLDVGRFVPDHFDTIVTPGMPCPTGLACPTLTVANDQGFVYSGQLLTTNVYARNAAGGATLNYDWTLGLSKQVTLSAWDALGGTTTQNPPLGNGGFAPNGNIAPAAAFKNGSTLLGTPVNPAYSFTTTPTVPTDIYLRAMDADSVTSLRVPANTSVEGGIKVVSGRIKISNAYGSELLPLTMTATAQYYSSASAGWVISLTDSAANLTFTPSYNVVSNGVTAGTTNVTTVPVGGTMSGGKLSVKLSKPGVKGVATVNPTAPSYLPINSATATFGVYKEAKEFIYLREAY